MAFGGQSGDEFAERRESDSSTPVNVRNLRQRMADRLAHRFALALPVRRNQDRQVRLGPLPLSCLVLDRVLQVGPDELDSERLQRLWSCRDPSFGVTESDVLMLGARRLRLVLMAGVTIVSPKERGPVTDIESIAANVDCVVAFGGVHGCRQTHARRDQNAVDLDFRDARVAVGSVHRKVTRQRRRPPADLDERLIDRSRPLEQEGPLRPRLRGEWSGVRR